MLSERAAGREKTVDPETAWDAVLARDSTFDGRFVYGVTSTRVYCRPSCPSRRPRRSRVRFFPAVTSAEQAGFRACLRCRPREQFGTRADEAVSKACAFLDAHPDERVTLARLSKAVGLSPFHLQRNFKRLTGVSPKEYASTRRLQRFKSRVRERGSVTAAVYEAGYGSSSRLYEQAGARLGMTPATYGRGGKGMSIRFGVVSSAMGRTLVGATERGLCAVFLGDSDARLEAELRREYPLADIAPMASDFQDWLSAVARYLEGKTAGLDLPLDVHATAFQWRVYKALQQIPPGRTRSYKEVAIALGQPNAVRAVARACATNRVALVVPCHRVVRSDGEVGGYRWGTGRKERLLEQERQAAQAD